MSSFFDQIAALQGASNPDLELLYPAIDTYKSGFQPGLQPESYYVDNLLDIALESLHSSPSASAQEAMKQLGDWISKWSGPPADEEMLPVIDTLGRAFFIQVPGLNRFSKVRFRWDTARLQQQDRFGETHFEGGKPSIIFTRKDDFSKAHGTKDHRSAIISVLLHELVHVFFGLYCREGKDKGNEWMERVLGIRGHGAHWFLLAAQVQVAAQKAFPDLDIRLGITSSTAGEYQAFQTRSNPAEGDCCLIPGRKEWHLLTERFNDDTIEVFLSEMTPEMDQALRKAYEEDRFLSCRGLKVAVCRMQWIRDGHLPGLRMVDGNMLYDCEEVSQRIPRDDDQGNPTEEELLTQPSYPPRIALMRTAVGQI